MTDKKFINDEIESKIKVASFWVEHIKMLERKNVENEFIAFLSAITNINNIGYEQGEIRPNLELSKWDVLYMLQMFTNCPHTTAEMCFLAGMNYKEVVAKEKEEFGPKAFWS